MGFHPKGKGDGNWDQLHAIEPRYSSYNDPNKHTEAHQEKVTQSKGE